MRLGCSHGHGKASCQFETVPRVTFAAKPGESQFASTSPQACVQALPHKGFVQWDAHAHSDYCVRADLRTDFSLAIQMLLDIMAV